MANPPNTPTPPPTKPASPPPPISASLPPIGERRPDAYERAIIEGKVTDHEGKVIPADRAAPVQSKPLDEGEQESLKGELRTGDIGWVPLDEKGAPSGPATKFPPRDIPAAPVATIVPSAPRVLATPAGAFLTDSGMQPSPHTNKYHTSAYDRDYNAIAKARGELPGDGGVAEKYKKSA